MMTMTTWLWMGWKTIRCCKFTGIPLLIGKRLINLRPYATYQSAA
jgi:hypothetical protein